MSLGDIVSLGGRVPTPPEVATLRLTVAGSAAAWSREPGHASSSYLLELGRRAIVLDLGQGAFSALSAFRDPARLDAVLVSHLHPDHCIDLVPLRHYLRFGCIPARSLMLHAPADLPARIDALTGQPDFLGELVGPPLEGGDFEVAGFAVAVAPVLHVGPSYAFRVAPAASPDAPGLVYSGDVGRVEDVLPLIREGDTLLIEASFADGPIEEGPNHLNAQEAARAAVEGRASRLILTHILDGYDRTAALEAARRVFPGESLLAEPGLRVEF